MNSIKRKLQYRFRVHNKEELDLISKYIKRRRIGAMGWNAIWVEFNDIDKFMGWVETQKYCDLMIRVYFSADFKRDKFKEQIKRTLPTWVCGNDNCSNEKCEYYMYNNTGKHVEYSWRCILADDNYAYEEDC